MERWLRGKVRCSHDAEDLAAEVVVRTWQRFHDSVVPWRHLSAWGFCAARNLLVDYWRRRDRAPVANEIGDDVADPVGEACSLAEDVRAFQVALSACATRAELETMDLLALGVVATADLAAGRRIGVRAAAKSLASLRARALTMWKDSRVVPILRAPAS